MKRRICGFPSHTSNGVTLVELMIAVLILSAVVLVFINIFANITKAILGSKAKTLATNLAQEKIQILRQMSYHKILITPAPAYNTEFSPPIPYDTTYFPPENILEGGMEFTRYTYVYPVQEVDGKFEPIPPTSPDVGLKCIEVSVVYQSGYGKKVVRLRTVESSIESAFKGAIQGTVRNAQTFENLRDVLVTVAENVGCRDYTDASGKYTIKVPYGNYTVVASKLGFFTATRQVSVGANPQTVNFDLQPMSSGTVFGYVWLNDRILISQVVGSTRSPGGFIQEYVELYNPTTFWWQMATSEDEGIIGLKYQSTGGGPLVEVPLKYINLSIPPSSYYLIANTTTVTVCGVSVTADAIYSEEAPGYPNAIKTREDDGPQSSGGGVGIYYISSNKWIDILGWDWNEGAKTAPIYETDGFDQFLGLETDEQYVRRVSTWGIVSGWGNAYDTDNNNRDFVEYRKPIQIPPRNSSYSLPPLTGRPAVGSFVSSNDGLSSMTNAYPVGSPPAAYFELTSVATGTWSIFISSNEKFININNVEIRSAGKTGVMNLNTDPPAYCQYYYSQLINVTQGGYISGRVVNALNQPLSNIKVVAGGSEAYTSATGRYILSLSTGIYSVTANPGNLNPLYVYQTREGVRVQQGLVTSGIDFVLFQGGRVTGFVSRDKINPLPGIVMQAQSQEGFIYGEDVSDNAGKFIIPNLSTGTYYIKPVLSSKETSSPSVSTVTISAAGATVFAGTFTITGAMGKISGKVIYNGKPIKTGVLIIATTTTITAPPTLSTATLTSTAYFLTSSYEDGTYTLEVIGSTTTPYKIYGYYTTYNNAGIPVIRSTSKTNVSVSPGQEVKNQDLIF
jgi:type II secretory pathway pseudopilin PulG